MSRLGPVKPDTRFIDLDALIHDAADMADVVDAIVLDLFSIAEPSGVYKIADEDGHRLLFLARLAADMAEKVRQAFAIAHANHVETKKLAGVGSERS